MIGCWNKSIFCVQLKKLFLVKEKKNVFIFKKPGRDVCCIPVIRAMRLRGRGIVHALLTSSRGSFAREPPPFLLWVRTMVCVYLYGGTAIYQPGIRITTTVARVFFFLPPATLCKARTRKFEASSAGPPSFFFHFILSLSLLLLFGCAIFERVVPEPPNWTDFHFAWFSAFCRRSVGRQWWWWPPWQAKVKVAVLSRQKEPNVLSQLLSRCRESGRQGSSSSVLPPPLYFLFFSIFPVVCASVYVVICAQVERERKIW